MYIDITKTLPIGLVFFGHPSFDVDHSQNEEAKGQSGKSILGSVKNQYSNVPGHA